MPYADWAWHLAGPVVAIVCFTILSIFGRKRGLKFLDGWARAQGFVLVSAQRRLFVPYWRWQSSKGYQYFRVVVRDRDGVLRRNWTRCSDFAFTDPAAIEVIWDDPVPRTEAA